MAVHHNEQLLHQITELLENNQLQKISALLNEYHPADIAEVLKMFNADEREAIFIILGPEKAAQVIDDLEEIQQEELLEGLDEKVIARIMDEMPSDDAADLLTLISEEKAETVLEGMGKEESEEVQKLLLFPEDSAGGIMTTNFFALEETLTVDEAITEIRKQEEDIEDPFYYVYVTNKKGVLIGIISLRNLIISPGGKLLKDIMKPDPLSVKADVDQEVVAHIVAKYDVNAVAVIDSGGHLIGRITVDDVIDVIKEEDTEDIYKMIGTKDDELLEKSIFRIAGIRLPWLLVTLVGELFACFLMKGFETTLSQVIALAFFIPIIMAIGGNIGIQSSTIIIRGLATGRIDFSRVWQVLFKEMRIGALMGLTCGCVVGIAAWSFGEKGFIGYVVGISMFVSICVAATVGSMIPILFKKLHIDPAIASGPFITTANDISGLLIYFSLASFLLHIWG